MYNCNFFVLICLIFYYVFFDFSIINLLNTNKKLTDHMGILTVFVCLGRVRMVLGALFAMIYASPTAF